eukprot:Rhum_TRINITY_DN13747_c0_g1::Rhum_TRINITY_DN13747_c0_g1_i1::g.63669::m.63669/K08869/ADCK, ABC1; aarF domain-containing kinase
MGRTVNIALGGLGAVAAGGVGLGYADEGVGRAQTFWSRGVPVYLRYRWVQFLHKDVSLIDDAEAARRYEALHEKLAPKMKQLVCEMRGFYLKNAQMMATREDFFPRQYLEWMREMEDMAPTPFAEGDAERIVEAELGCKIDDVFSFFDPVPAGVASIGQVHRAVLKESGKEVAVKVQHWSAEELFRGDIRTQKSFCSWFAPQEVPAFDEIETQFLTEFDYVAEARNLDTIKGQLEADWGHKVVVPASHPKLCSRRVLTMDYLHGVKLIEGIRASYQDLADRMGQPLEEIEAEQKRMIKSGELQLKSPQQEATDNRRLSLLLRVQDIFANVLRMLANLTPLPYVYGLATTGVAAPLPMQWTKLPLNLGEIIGLLITVHGDQLFKHGAINGDPHPGNILLMEDGRLGLIDFGQVKKLNETVRKTLADVMVGLANDDVDAVANSFRELGSKTKYGRNDVGYRLAAFWMDRDTDDIMTWEGKVLNIADFLDAMEAADPVIEVPSDVIMPGRMIVILRGLALALGMRVSMAKFLQPQAQGFLDKHFADQNQNLEVSPQAAVTASGL